jgi:hypothetical protein
VEERRTVPTVRLAPRPTIWAVLLMEVEVEMEEGDGDVVLALALALPCES